MTTTLATTAWYFSWCITDWCNRLFGAKLNTTQLAELAKALGCKIDLVDFENWETVALDGGQVGCCLPDMGQDVDGNNIAPFVPGFNNPAHNERTFTAINTALDRCAANGVKYILVFTGYDTSEEKELQYSRIVGEYTRKRKELNGESLIDKAERLGITFVIEMLNTLGDEETWRGHPGYLGNSVAEVVEGTVVPIRSDNFKLLFDLYHVAMMGDDILNLIEAYHQHFGYVHVAGQMGVSAEKHPRNRGELTIDGQRIDFAECMAALAKYLPKGFPVLLEYIPNTELPESIKANLGAAIAVCESKIPAPV